jgi:acetolactate synthase-1/2/3 large subunit
MGGTAFAKCAVIVPGGDAMLASPEPRESQTVARALVQAFAEAGVSHAFGVTGGAIAPFAHALSQGPIEIVHCRHESGAAFAAVERYFATGRPGLIFTTTGPGVTNALTGLAAARWEGAKLVLVSPTSPPAHRGRWSFQETDAGSLAHAGSYPNGALFHYTATLDHGAMLPVVVNRMLRGLLRPGPFVAHIQVPPSIQDQPAECRVVRPETLGTRGPSRETVARVRELLHDSSFALWVGFGARDAAPLVRDFAERTGAPVMSSARGKGIFPETHPHYLGVTGFGGHASVDDYLAAERPDYLLVLGSRLGEMTSMWDRNLLPAKGIVHVDLEADTFGAAYPEARTLGIECDVGTFLKALLDDGEPVHSRAAKPEADPFPRAPLARAQGRVRPQVLMAELQLLLEREDAIVISEAGNAFAWATHHLRFSSATRYRTSFGFGSMGHATTGVLGAALDTGRRAIAVVGDGAMLMNSEVSTAVEHRAPAIWIVLNDGGYGMMRQGMAAVGYQPFATEIPHADFARIAEASGARGIKVTSELGLGDALASALVEAGPVVVDVDIEREEIAPTGKRNVSLGNQGVAGAARRGSR